MQYRVQILRSKRKTLAIQVASADQVIVRAPLRLPQSAVEAFLKEREDWIALHLEKANIREKERRAAVPFSAEEIAAMKRQAAQALPPLCAALAEKMGVRYRKITVRCQKTRWGSCSRQGNLNFNCLLMACPRAIQAYVAVHELCHLKEMNHSPKFWQAVRAAYPDCDAARRWLKTEGQKLIMRLP